MTEDEDETFASFDAFPRMNWRVLLFEWLGTLILSLLALAWLHIPDSFVWEFVLSVLAAVAIVVVFFALQMKIFRMLRRPPASRAFWKGLGTCLVLLVLWLIVFFAVGEARSHAPLWAGYWNSKLPASWRVSFTYERLLIWQRIFWNLLQWLWSAALLPLAVESATSEPAAWRRIAHVYRRWWFWTAAAILGFGGAAAVAALAGWLPGGTAGAEIESAILRTLAAYTIVILFVTYMLSLTAIYLDRALPDYE